uniref:Uncharacterized protein n=1 Tax=Phlebotomus papatasi TaxID=29031 RepID=A0A1B0D0T1_PHLPP
MEKFLTEGWSYFGTLRLLIDSVRQSLQAANATLHTEEFQMIAEESYDLILVEMFFNNFLIGLGDHFHCPVITISSVPPTEIVNEISGNPSTVAIVPHFLLGNVNGMTFFNRLLNYFFVTVEKIIWKVIDWREGVYYEANFPSSRYKSFEKMKKNISLFFVNDHFSISSPRPYVPAVVPVAGINIKQQPDPLPQKIQEFIDNAEHGVIYFSLGSIMKSTFLPPRILDTILNVLSKLKQKVVFKWEDDQLPNQPDNVLIEKWLPQSDILAQKKVKLFICHGGMGAMNEAKYNGIPVIGIPFFADQRSNLITAQQEGWAIVLDLYTLTEESLLTTINQVLYDHKYRNTVQHISKVFKDRPMTALDTALYWTEYVIRHKGAAHLQSRASHLNWMQKISLDVLIFYFVLMVLAFKGTIFVYLKMKNIKIKLRITKVTEKSKSL